MHKSEAQVQGDPANSTPKLGSKGPVHKPQLPRRELPKQYGVRDFGFRVWG